MTVIRYENMFHNPTKFFVLYTTITSKDVGLTKRNYIVRSSKASRIQLRCTIKIDFKIPQKGATEPSKGNF